MIRLTLTLLLIFLSFAWSMAQSGLRQLQIAAQANRPISSLLTVSSFGYGGSLKGLYGFSTRNQQATVEVGYHRFPIKYEDANINLHYSAIPVYVGYRYIYNRLVLEPQLGVSVNRIDGSNGINSASTTFYNFGLSIGAAYVIKNLEIGARCQISEINDKEEDLNFLGIRLAYNIKL